MPQVCHRGKRQRRMSTSLKRKNVNLLRERISLLSLTPCKPGCHLKPRAAGAKRFDKKVYIMENLYLCLAVTISAFCLSIFTTMNREPRLSHRTVEHLCSASTLNKPHSSYNRTAQDHR